MNPPMDQDFDALLPQWQSLPVANACTGLLLGNGGSRAIWRNFGYDSLFERAQKVRNRPLGQSDLALFKHLNTENFERVLSSLNTTVRINAALAISSTAPLNRYYAIKEALIHAMRSVHIPWPLVSPQTLEHLNRALRQYPTVYSTNYDLLCHWAMLHSPQGFDDWMSAEGEFDPQAGQPGTTRLLYLHGGLHLIKHADGSTRRRSAVDSALLDGFAINTPGDVPLFVAEGPSRDKLASIRDSAYLSGCLQQLRQHQGPLCLFGHNLNAQDQHIIDSLLNANVEQLAIAIFPLSDAWIISQKRHYATLFRESATALEFFDATSHPLGLPTLNVPVIKEKPVRPRR
jgi:hypothetical protein